MIETTRDPKEWDSLRSDIYIRDKGVCWVCNTFVDWRDYDLGHLIDRCNGGWNDYDNLAVMHSHCNSSKPRHTTLEEAMRWKLTILNPMRKSLPPTSQLIPPQPKSQNMPIKQELKWGRLSPEILERAASIPTPVIIPTPKTITRKRSDIRKVQRLFLAYEDKDAVQQLVIKYFNKRPGLLIGKINPARSEAIRQLSETLKCPIQYIRQWMVKAGLVDAKVYITNGSQYKYIYEHLDELINKYNNQIPLGLQQYHMDIFFYLAGMIRMVHPDSLHGIKIRVAQLGIPVRSP